MKVTMVLDEREVNTLADLVREELGRTKAQEGAYQSRSIVRLAVKVNELAKARGGRWAVLSDAPTWVFTYLARPIFPEVLSDQQIRDRRARARTMKALDAPRRKAPKRMLPAGAGLGIKPKDAPVAP